MKEKILVTAAVVLALAGAGYAAIHHRNQNVYHKEQAESVAEQKAIAAQKAEQAAKQKAAAELAARQAAALAAAKAKTTTIKTVR